MIEFLASRNDTPLFAFATHTKKRSHSLIFGRLYDGQLLDMIEVYINQGTFKSISDWSTEREATVKFGVAPCIIFNGDDFENETKPDIMLLKNLLLDMFRATSVDKINLAGLDRVIVCTTHNDLIYFRQYAIVMKKSGSKFPRVELEEIVPTMDWKIGRVKSAPHDLKARSLRTVKQVRKKGHVLKKNIETGPMGHKTGRIYLEHQELNKMATKKMKGLKKKRKRDTNDETQDQDQSNLNQSSASTQNQSHPITDKSNE